MERLFSWLRTCAFARKVLRLAIVATLALGAYADGTKVPAGDGLRRDCSDGEILTWEAATSYWICATASGTGDMLLGTSQTVTANKSFADTTLRLNGATSGVTTLIGTDAATATITMPSATATLPGLGLANVFTTAQTIQPATDVVPLTLRRLTAANLLQLQTAANVPILTIDGSGNLIYEGTDDGFETTITFTDPTADRTITFPDSDVTIGAGGGIGGSTGATDNAIPRADGTEGATLQASVVTISDTGVIVGNQQGGLDLSVLQKPSIGDHIGSRYLTVNTGSGVTQVSSYGLGIVDNLSSSAGTVVALWKSPTSATWRAEGASSALGYVMFGVPIEVNTTTKSPSITESGECYTNTGDADGSTINLPNDPTIGSQVCVLLTVSQSVTVAPAAGETISDAGTAYSTSCVADALGESITLVAATGGSGATWVPRSKVGTWTCS